jgi:hypothetical protein
VKKERKKQIWLSTASEKVQREEKGRKKEIFVLKKHFHSKFCVCLGVCGT